MTSQPSPSGSIRALWIKRAKRGPMDPAESVELEAGRGIRGNANQGGRRQVTLIEEEVFEALREELGEAVEPVMRRANVMVRGVRLARTRDRILRLGPVRIEIRGETRPCNLMDETLPGLQDALDPDWRGGVYGQVLSDGTVRVGDEVRWEDAVE